MVTAISSHAIELECPDSRVQRCAHCAPAVPALSPTVILTGYNERTCVQLSCYLFLFLSCCFLIFSSSFPSILAVCTPHVLLHLIYCILKGNVRKRPQCWVCFPDNSSAAVCPDTLTVRVTIISEVGRNSFITCISLGTADRPSMGVECFLHQL